MRKPEAPNLSWSRFAQQNPGCTGSLGDEPPGWRAGVYAPAGRRQTGDGGHEKSGLGWLALVFFSLLLPFSAAHAQSIEERLRDQLRATVNQLHQLQDDGAALQAQKAQAEQERDQLKAELAAAKAEAARSRSNGAQTRELEGEVSKYKDAVAEATTSAQKAQADQTKLQADLTDAKALFGACEEKNAALLKTGNDILDSFQNFDVGDALGANEPFIRIKRVDLENAAQDYDDKLRSGKFDPSKVKLPAARSESR